MMGDKEKIKKICKPYPYEKYRNIDLNSLAAYSIHLLKKKDIFLNFENVAVALFLMFPKKFCMVNYEEYPDTNRIGRTVNLQLRPKYQNLAYGNPQKGYSLTNKGQAIAEQVESILSSKVKNPSLKKSELNEVRKDRTTSIQDEIEKRIFDKPLYKKYLKDKNCEVSKLEIYEFLSASSYTSKRVLREHFLKLKKLCKRENNKEALDFLVWLYQKSNIILGGK